MEGYKTPLIDVAGAAGKAVGTINVDAVQPTRNGWQIYVKMEKDCTVLLATGLDLAGKHISLESRTLSAPVLNVKITVKDLPLHEVSNEAVLEAVKQIAPVASPVKYSNIWIDGHCTHLRNCDRFFYVAVEEVDKFPRSLLVGDIKARILKPVVYARCSRCDQRGHQPSDPECLALVPPEVQALTEAFCGLQNPLSNLYVCSEGCT